MVPEDPPPRKKSVRDCPLSYEKYPIRNRSYLACRSKPPLKNSLQTDACDCNRFDWCSRLYQIIP